MNIEENLSGFILNAEIRMHLDFRKVNIPAMFPGCDELVINIQGVSAELYDSQTKDYYINDNGKWVTINSVHMSYPRTRAKKNRNDLVFPTAGAINHAVISQLQSASKDYIKRKKLGEFERKENNAKPNENDLHDLDA